MKKTRMKKTTETPSPAPVKPPVMPDFSVAIGDGAVALRPLELVIKISSGTYRTEMTLCDWAVVYSLMKKLVRDPEGVANG